MWPGTYSAAFSTISRKPSPSRTLISNSIAASVVGLMHSASAARSSFAAKSAEIST